MDSPVLDHSVISHFRGGLTKKSAYEKLFKATNKQRKEHRIIVKTGAIVDASIIDSPLKPMGKTRNEIETDRSGEKRPA